MASRARTRTWRSVRSGDREAVLGPGGYITKPRGEAHAKWNTGSEPARMIEVISPAGFELFFRAVVDLLESGDVDPERGAALAAEHGLEFVDTSWLANVVRRFGLNASCARAHPSPHRTTRSRAASLIGSGDPP